jgi:hypothetical protein
MPACAQAPHWMLVHAWPALVAAAAQPSSAAFAAT